MYLALIVLFSLFELIQVPCLHAAEWSETEIQYLHGSEFHEPFNPDTVTKDIITIQNASGYSFGRSFFFIDLLQSDDHDQNAQEAYSEGYLSVSLGKSTGMPLAWGPVRDINITGGINYGYKSYPSYGINPLVLLPGITVDLNLPGFSFFNVDLLAYIDRGRIDSHDNGCHATSYQITPAWKLPFTIWQEKFSVEGFADFIGAHGNCTSQILTQPQLRWDVGNHFGKPGQVFASIEYQYWRNKFGVNGTRESFPQVLLIWKF
ncbi:conserved hypothetical protein [Gammaproteobacteria bacterium]